MQIGAKSLALAAVMTLALAPSATARDQHRPSHSEISAELLEAHNEERARFGAPSLSWSKELERDAQNWANKLAREGVMRHATLDERRGRGENLWAGTAGYYSPYTMVDAFLSEKRHFKPGTFPHVSRTGRWRDVGHYTQVVWRDTREVGCAIARDRYNDFLVCRYWPAGNIYGREVG